MKIKSLIVCAALSLAGLTANAQWVVSDPGNLAQGIINASKNIVHTSSTASTMLNNFQETVKIYEQGKAYYDALKRSKTCSVTPARCSRPSSWSARSPTSM